MTLLEVLRLAAGALLGNRGRSALTVLSITIGAFAIVVMSSLAQSGLSTLERGIEELGGARILFVAQRTPERGEAKQQAYARGLTLADRERIFDGVPHVESVSLFSRLGRRDVLAETGARGATDLIAGDAGFFNAFRMKVARGRAFDETDDRAQAPVCVVGHKLVEKLGAGDLLGHSLTVGPLRCRVIGVLADNDRMGVGFGFDWTDLIIAPGETMAALDPSVRLRAAAIVKTDAARSNDAVKRMLNARMLARHAGLDDFTLYDFSGIIEKSRTVFAAMELIVALLAGIALVIGGVGVMNMMLVGVSERVREIGVRKALGARPSDIAAQFLAESILLAGAGGAVGVASGLLVSVAAAFGIARMLPRWQPSLAPIAAVSAFAVSLAIGALFGWLPSRRAAALSPVEAMRR